MKKLRLLFTKDCNRLCEGCCNKQYDLDNLKIVDHYNYDEILITGGEPLLYPIKLFYLINEIKKKSKAKIILYTAKTYIQEIASILPLIDGLTLTIHNKDDIDSFRKLDNFLITYSDQFNFETKSLRLNIFKMDASFGVSLLWTIKRNIEWIKDCPLPKNEVFMKI